jgi:hypothetical protein
MSAGRLGALLFSHKNRNCQDLPRVYRGFTGFDEGVVRAEGFEPPTPWFVAKCSIQMSYARTAGKF